MVAKAKTFSHAGILGFEGVCRALQCFAAFCSVLQPLKLFAGLCRSLQVFAGLCRCLQVFAGVCRCLQVFAVSRQNASFPPKLARKDSLVGTLPNTSRTEALQVLQTASKSCKVLQNTSRPAKPSETHQDLQSTCNCKHFKTCAKPFHIDHGPRAIRLPRKAINFTLAASLWHQCQ